MNTEGYILSAAHNLGMSAIQWLDTLSSIRALPEVGR